MLQYNLVIHSTLMVPSWMCSCTCAYANQTFKLCIDNMLPGISFKASWEYLMAFSEFLALFIVFTDLVTYSDSFKGTVGDEFPKLSTV